MKSDSLYCGVLSLTFSPTENVSVSVVAGGWGVGLQHWHTAVRLGEGIPGPNRPIDKQSITWEETNTSGAVCQ